MMNSTITTTLTRYPNVVRKAQIHCQTMATRVVDPKTTTEGIMENPIGARMKKSEIAMESKTRICFLDRARRIKSTIEEKIGTTVVEKNMNVVNDGIETLLVSEGNEIESIGMIGGRLRIIENDHGNETEKGIEMVDMENENLIVEEMGMIEVIETEMGEMIEIEIGIEEVVNDIESVNIEIETKTLY